MEERSNELPEEDWREIAVAEGSQGPRSYRFSAQRVRPTSRRKPGEIHWAIYRRNLDGSEPRYYLSNAPEDTPLETLAYVGGSLQDGPILTRPLCTERPRRVFQQPARLPAILPAWPTMQQTP